MKRLFLFLIPLFLATALPAFALTLDDCQGVSSQECEDLLKSNQDPTTIPTGTGERCLSSEAGAACVQEELAKKSDNCTNLADNDCGEGFICCGKNKGPNAQTSSGEKASTGAGTSVDIYDPLQNAGLLSIIGSIVKAFLGIAGSIAFLAFVYAGISYLVSGGDDKKISQAKATMVNTVLGLIIILMSYQMTSYILTLVGQ